MRNWIDSLANSEDIIINSSTQLARNIKDVNFIDKINIEIAKDNVDKVYHILKTSCENENFELIKLWEQEYNYVKGYYYKDLISNKLLDRKEMGAFIINEDNTLSIIINEEDHIVIRCISDGLDLLEEFDYCNRIDDIIEEKIPYSFHEKLGYLTSSPKNIGTALRASVEMHLPALKFNKELANISKELKSNGMEIKSKYIKDNKDYGNVFIISNTITLGISEEDIISNLKEAVSKVVKEEKNTRKILIAKYKYEIEDKIFRSLAIIKNARVLSSMEVIEYLSYVRLGVELGLININKDILNHILVETRDEIIINTLEENFSERDINIERARVVKELLIES